MTTTFADLGVPTDIVAALAAHGIESPFAIQALTVADGLAGRDLCGRAPTGSGKTIAFGIPLATRTPRADPKRPTALVLVPTRELASQVCKEVEWLGRSRRLRVAAVYGGAGYAPQLKALRRGVDVLVACPGRLTDLIERGEVFLDAVGMVVVDEADRMADMGFLPVVKRLLDQTSASRQTLLFSATLDGAVDTLVRRYQNDPARHLLPEEPEGGVRATHVFWAVEREERVQVCADLVKLAGPTIVFCKTKHGTDQLARKLGNLGVRADAIHGNRSQGQRERALGAFATGAVDALIATDVAARGIHVDGVACVLHFDPPNDEKDYTHRSGRTARAGAGGTVVSFVSTDQARDSARLQKALGLRTRVVTPDRAALASVTPESVSTRVIVDAPPPSPVFDGSAAGPRGIVKWFDARKGFGFIERRGAEDLFVHCSEIQGTADRRLEEGQQVVFEIGAGRKGDEARKVRIAS